MQIFIFISFYFHCDNDIIFCEEVDYVFKSKRRMDRGYYRANVCR
jgi:hypothetical protein